MYILNLLFDLTQADNKENGLFSSAAGGTPLTSSKQWLQLEPDGGHPDNPVGLNVETATWQRLGGNDSHVSLSKQANPGFIGVRIASATAIDANSTLSIFVVFGKPDAAEQRHASPFTFNDQAGGRVQAEFHLHPAIRANSGSAWFFPLKPISKAPAANEPDLVHRYEFLVGVRLTVPVAGRPDDIYTFGEDPEMDVSI